VAERDYILTPGRYVELKKNKKMMGSHLKRK
jgi:hypothetical protein